MKIGKIAISFTLLILLLSNVYSQDSLYIASWNVENLFDTVNDTNKTDEIFTPGGAKQWDARRLDEKMHNLAKVIASMNAGKGPDVLGLIEIEHKYLVDSLMYKYFPGRNYKTVSYESPDSRGIQNAVVYDSDELKLLESQPIEVEFFSDYKTRDILYVKLEWHEESLELFVNHWPSRRGGIKQSEPRRMNAASTLRRFIDSGKDFGNIVIMGDFNDEPDDLSLTEVLRVKCKMDKDFDRSCDAGQLLNIAFSSFEQGKGTHLYSGEYNFLDQIVVNGALLDAKGAELIKGSFEIVMPPFAVTERFGKAIILPSFHDSEYLGGFSDHFPVAAKFIFKPD